MNRYALVVGINDYADEENIQSRGGVKDVIKGEIERLFRDVDHLGGRRAILDRNLDEISKVEAKVAELEAAGLRGASAEELDDLALRAEEEFAELKVEDRAARDLEGVKYEAPPVKPMSVEERTAEIAGEKKKKTSLPADIERRLRKLQAEEE